MRKSMKEYQSYDYQSLPDKIPVKNKIQSQFREELQMMKEKVIDGIKIYHLEFNDSEIT